MEEGMQQEEHGQLAERFYRKSMDLARKGIFGRSLKTYVPALREAYIHWLSLLDHKDIPVLLYGEKGTGKRKHVEEYFYLQNLHASLAGEIPGKFKVFCGDFVDVGFTQLFYSPKTQVQDVIYLEHVDRMSVTAQEELLEYLVLRKEMSQRGIPVPRLFVGTERALSLSVMKGSFSKALFQQLTSFAIFMPSLRDRAQDLPHLLIEFIQELSGKKQLPPVWLVDALSGLSLYENMDELKQVLKNMIAKNSDVGSWKKSDFPLSPRMEPRDPSFSATQPEDATRQMQEKRKLSEALKAYRGDPTQVAQSEGLSRAEILRKMMVYGLR
jgi:DNA-binding NtrC family response regulator